MSQCKRCSSHAINPSLHGRQPGVDLDLCDVCYWRVRARLKDGLTYEEVITACANIGINLQCGGCASEFYTGHSELHDKDCSRFPPLYQVKVSNGQITELKAMDDHRGTSAYEIDYLRGYLEMPLESTDEEVRRKVLDELRALAAIRKIPTVQMDIGYCDAVSSVAGFAAKPRCTICGALFESHEVVNEDGTRGHNCHRIDLGGRIVYHEYSDRPIEELYPDLKASLV